jgi:putative transposase
MRKSRRKTLSKTGLFHKMWRGHNREPVLEEPLDKQSYLEHLADTLTDSMRECLLWFSYCLMGNHAHETGALARDEDNGFDAALKCLGNWMRNGHSRFGQEFNRRHERQGKVAYDRPKTKEIDDDAGVLQVMFYGDANPVRAGKVSHPSLYQHSSYRFYAYGEESELTAKLTPPPAYLALGSTPSARQHKYRSLCDAYLRREGMIDDRPSEEVEEPQGLDDESGPGGDEEARARGGPPMDAGEDFF